MSAAALSARRSNVNTGGPFEAGSRRGGGETPRGIARTPRTELSFWDEHRDNRRAGVYPGHERLDGVGRLHDHIPGTPIRDSTMSSPRGTPSTQRPTGSPNSTGSPRISGVSKPFYAGSPIAASTARALLPFLAKWVGGVCRQALDENNLMDQLKNGLILCQLVENLVPNLNPLDKPFTGSGLHPRPRANKAMLSNLERALSVAWRRGLHSFNMCSAEDFLNGNVPKVARCLAELFQALQMRDILTRAKENMLGMHAVLASLGRPLLEPTLHDPLGFGQHLVADFADCTRVVTLLTAFGYAEVEDLAKLYGVPKEPEQWRENQIATNDLLTKIGCPALLFPHEWASPPGSSYDTLLFQLDVIWRGLNGCAFPGLLNNLKRFKRPNLKDFQFKDGTPLRLSSEHLQQTAANMFEFSGTVNPRDIKGARGGTRPDSPRQASNVADGVSWLKQKQKQQGLKVGMSPARGAESELSSPPGSPSRPGANPLWEQGDDLDDLVLLQDFKAVLLKNFGKVDAAYDAFDSRKAGFISLSDFQRVCNAIDFVGDVRRLFHKLDIEGTKQVGKVSFFSLSSLPPSGTSLPPSRRKTHTATQPVILWRKGDNPEDLDMLTNFSTTLLQAFGSWDEAWRQIDHSGNGTMSLVEMDSIVHRIEFHGNFRRVFALLDKKKDGHITRQEFDGLKLLLEGAANGAYDDKPEYSNLWQEGEPIDDLILLREFAAALHAYQFSSLDEAFDAFDLQRAGVLNINSWHSGARQIDFKDVGKTQKLFVLLDVDRDGLVERQEFVSLDNLPPLPLNNHQPRWIASRRLKHMATKGQVELLVDFPETDAADWPIESERVSTTSAEEGEARFPGSAEERAWLLEEEVRRLSSLQEGGNAVAARKVLTAMREAAIAAGDVADEAEIQDTDAAVNLQVQGTTSIDARVVMQDGTQQRMWVQTAVVDRTGTGSSAADDAVLVLEIRDRTSQRYQGNALHKMRGQLDISTIVAVSQLGSGADSEVRFSITAKPQANLAVNEGLANSTAQNELEAVPPGRPNMEDLLHWDERRQNQVLYVVAGPSAWRRREAVRFFDELRILQHFVSEGVATAATSIGAAAGAAVSAAAAGAAVSAAVTFSKKQADAYW